MCQKLTSSYEESQTFSCPLNTTCIFHSIKNVLLLTLYFTALLREQFDFQYTIPDFKKKKKRSKPGIPGLYMTTFATRVVVIIESHR